MPHTRHSFLGQRLRPALPRSSASKPSAQASATAERATPRRSPRLGLAAEDKQPREV